MADNSKKLSQLPIATNTLNTDRVLILHDPAGSPSTRTIAVNNFISSLYTYLPYANSSTVGVIKVGNNLSINATGHLTANTGNFTFTNNVISANGAEFIIRGEDNYSAYIISNNYSQIQYNPNTSVTDSYAPESTWAYVGDEGFGAEAYSNIGNVQAAIYANKAGDVELYSANNVSIRTDSATSNWEFTSSNKLVTPSNGVEITTPRVANTKYSLSYYDQGQWGGYTQLDKPAGNSSWAWVGTDIGNINDPFVVIEAKADNGSYGTWYFRADGVLNLPAGIGDIKRDGVSVIGTGQIDGGNAFTPPTAEITVDGGGA